jgi:hypothetical protein
MYKLVILGLTLLLVSPGSMILAKDEKVEIVPLPPEHSCYDFKKNLRIGDSGSDVVKLNEILVQEGFLSLISGDEKINTKVFSEYTAAAISNFQEKYRAEILESSNLTNGTGYFGDLTRNKINQSYACSKPSIKVIYPNGGETLKNYDKANIAKITWKTSGLLPARLLINIYLQDKSGALKEIATNLKNTGSYEWKSNSAIVSGSYKILIHSNDKGPSMEDSSDNFFSVVSGDFKPGDVSAVLAPMDLETEPGIVLADTESVLGKIRFTATNEDMTINKMDLFVSHTSSEVTSTLVADEVPVIKLYDGSTLLATGFVQNSGEKAGTVRFDNFGWVIAKDTNRVLTIKGLLNSIQGGADSGSKIYVGLSSKNFEASGSNTKDTTINSVIGNKKVIYKTKPTLAVSSPDSTLTSGEVKILKFRITADSKGQVSWKKMQFKVSMIGAAMMAANVDNTKIRDVNSGMDLTLSNAFSNHKVGSGTSSVPIIGGSNGYLTVILNTAQEIAAGSYKNYELISTFGNLSTTTLPKSVVVSPYVEERESNFGSVAYLEGVLDGIPSLIWSDNSIVGHNENSSKDWANGVYVKGFGDSVSSSNGASPAPTPNGKKTNKNMGASVLDILTDFWKEIF